MNLLSNFVISAIVVGLILGGPLTLYALVKIANAFFGAPKVQFVRLDAQTGSQLGLMVSWDPLSFPIELVRIRVEFLELVLGGRSAAFSYTFEDKRAKKSTFVLGLDLSPEDMAMLTDQGIQGQSRALERSSFKIEIEDLVGETKRFDIAKKKVLEVLSGPVYTAPKMVEVIPNAKPDAWSVLTRVFPWRKAAAQAEMVEEGASKGHAPAAAKVPGVKIDVDFLVTKVWIEPGCIVCDACEAEAPLVFHVLADTCIVRENAPLDDPASIAAAAEGCPVDVIKFDKVPKPKSA